MKLIAKQAGLLCTQPLRGYYRYGDLFQILPVVTKDVPLLCDHPLIVEICYYPDIWPDREQIFWYRDLWERERDEYIRNYSTKNEMASSDEWFNAYDHSTKQLRWPAIIDEVSGLLTLFTNHRFFTYAAKQHWCIPLGRRS